MMVIVESDMTAKKRIIKNRNASHDSHCAYMSAGDAATYTRPRLNLVGSGDCNVTSIGRGEVSC